MYCLFFLVVFKVSSLSLHFAVFDLLVRFHLHQFSWGCVKLLRSVGWDLLLGLEMMLPVYLKYVSFLISPFATHCCCSVAQSCSIVFDPMDCSTPGLPVHHQLPEFTQTQVYWVGDAIQPSHPLSSPSPPTFNLLQHQGLFQQVSSLHLVAEVLEFQLQHQSFQ